MATKSEVKRAKEICRQIQLAASKRHVRIHIESTDDNANRLRALEGICGDCQHLLIEPNLTGTRKGVGLRCTEGISPLNLFRDTELGEIPQCDSYYSLPLSEIS